MHSQRVGARNDPVIETNDSGHQPPGLGCDPWFVLWQTLAGA